MFLWTRRTQPKKSVYQAVKKVSLKCRKTITVIFFRLFSSGHVEYSFDNPAESYSCQSLEMLAQSPNRNFMKSVFSQNLFSQNVFLDSKMQFRQPCRKSVGQGPNKYSSRRLKRTLKSFHWTSKNEFCKSQLLCNFVLLYLLC